MILYMIMAICMYTYTQLIFGEYSYYPPYMNIIDCEHLTYASISGFQQERWRFKYHRFNSYLITFKMSKRHIFYELKYPFDKKMGVFLEALEYACPSLMPVDQ